MELGSCNPFQLQHTMIKDYDMVSVRAIVKVLMEGYRERFRGFERWSDGGGGWGGCPQPYSRKGLVLHRKYTRSEQRARPLIIV